ncbi:MAG: glycosyltransferase [bacterium]|nr:glycosyltransferase [bacterium]
MTRKVCLVGPAYPYRGGIAHFTSQLAREFRKDHDLFVVNFQRQYPSLLFPGKTQYDKSGVPLDLESERLIDSINPLSFPKAARAINEYRPDLVVFQWWHPFFAFAYRTISGRIRKRSDAKVVFLCHNVLPHESSVVDRVLIRHAFGAVDRFLVQSREDEENLKRIKPGTVSRVHPHPIYDCFNTGQSSKETARSELGVKGKVLLFFGYIRAYKGLGVLLTAFAETLRDGPATLLVVGEFYEKRDGYDAMIEELGIAEHVRIVDEYVPNEAVEKYFKACDVVVLPYLSATQSGIVQVAYGFDKPVIVTEVGGLPDVVDHGETGFVVPPRDSGALAAAIREFFNDGSPDRFEGRIVAAKSRFSWARCKELLIELGGA